MLWVLGFCIDLVGESVQVWFLQPIVSHSATRAKAILLRKVNIVFSMGSMAASRLDLYSSHAFIREASIMNQKRECQNFLLRSSIIAAILVKHINCPHMHVQIVVPHSWRSWNLPLYLFTILCQPVQHSAGLIIRFGYRQIAICEHMDCSFSKPSNLT